ncbi:MAG: hypothetical protein U1F58_00460 [Burkholderiales bacterium]
MQPTKRKTLKALSSLPLLATPVARAYTAGPINLVGYGCCGRRVLELLDRHGLIRGDHATVHIHKPETGLNLSETLHEEIKPHRGRPVVAIAGGGGRGNTNTLRMAQAYAQTWRGNLSALVFLPFEWEGPERLTRGLSLATQFGFGCPLVATLDNGKVLPAVLGDEEEISLLDCYHRVNAHVLPQVAQFLAEVRATA